MVGDVYYRDGRVTLYLGDCREVVEWLAADVLVTDPPCGRGWKQGNLQGATPDRASDAHGGIAGDESTEVRDAALRLWGARPGVVFGDLMLAPPPRTVMPLIYRKPPNAGHRGSMGGWRRDVEGVYLVGPWPSGLGGRSSIVSTLTASQGSAGPQGRYGHPHAKPVDVMETLISACPAGVIADPFAGSGSTLVAARNLGREAVGVEVDERYCEMVARRLAQDCLDLGV